LDVCGRRGAQGYAEFAKIRLDQARRVHDEFFPKKLVWPDRVRGLDTLMEDGVTFKYLSRLRRNGWLK
jgi:NitT/TauT family transport system substrate-binding protein